MNEYFIYYMYATTFLLEQYIYAPHVTIAPMTDNYKGDVFLDCGGCSGETAIWAILQGASKVYTFEPSPSNHACLVKNIQHHQLHEKITHVPLALGKEKGTISFEESKENPASSRISTQSKTSIDIAVTSLDIWCEENAVTPDFIKMDIEGAEVDAIIGAQKILKEYKPKLAICLYHKQSDMWDIPMILKSICPEYKFWCRKNAHVGEFVLYASV